MWILAASPFIRAQTRIEDLFINTVTEYDKSSLINTSLHVPLFALLNASNHDIGSFDLEFLQETILLARGPRVLVCKDKGFLNQSSNITRSTDMATTFMANKLIKILRKEG